MIVLIIIVIRYYNIYSVTNGKYLNKQKIFDFPISQNSIHT